MHAGPPAVASGSVASVFRRSLTLALALPLALAITGCSTFSDSSDVARVDDATLTEDDFQSQLVALGQSGDNVLNGSELRAEITRWVQENLISDDEIAAIYDSGMAASGTICINAIVVDDEGNAERVAGQLDGGAAFPEVFQKENLDQQLATTNGALPCITAKQVAESTNVAFVQVAATLDAETSRGRSAIADPDGNEIAWVVVSFRPFAELSLQDQDIVAGAIDISERANAADVFVDPRYGTFDPSTAEVVALG